MTTNLHCCESMRNASEDQDTAIVYTKEFKEYGIRILDGGTSHLRIYYCPWCGKKLRKRTKGGSPVCQQRSAYLFSQ